MTNLPEAVVDTDGANRPRVWIHLNEYGGWDVLKEGQPTGYGCVDRHTAYVTARDYARRNNCRIIDTPDGSFKNPLPMFEAYVDGLAKKGIIDGNIAERLLSYHRMEAADPRAPVREALKPILDEMFKLADSENTDGVMCYTLRGYAERIDDTLN